MKLRDANVGDEFTIVGLAAKHANVKCKLIEFREKDDCIILGEGMYIVMSGDDEILLTKNK